MHVHSYMFPAHGPRIHFQLCAQGPYVGNMHVWSWYVPGTPDRLWMHDLGDALCHTPACMFPAHGPRIHFQLCAPGPYVGNMHVSVSPCARYTCTHERGALNFCSPVNQWQASGAWTINLLEPNIIVYTYDMISNDKPLGPGFYSVWQWSL